MTIDIAYEKFGWMLCELDLVMVPFIFTMQVRSFVHSVTFLQLYDVFFFFELTEVSL